MRGFCRERKVLCHPVVGWFCQLLASALRRTIDPKRTNHPRYHDEHTRDTVPSLGSHSAAHYSVPVRYVGETRARNRRCIRRFSTTGPEFRALLNGRVHAGLEPEPYRRLIRSARASHGSRTATSPSPMGPSPSWHGTFMLGRFDQSGG